MTDAENLVALASAKPELIADAVLRKGDAALSEAATSKGIENSGRTYLRARTYLIEYRSYVACFAILLLYFSALYTILALTMRGSARDEKALLVIGSGVAAIHLVLSLRRKREAARVVERAQAARLLEASAQSMSDPTEPMINKPSNVAAKTRVDRAQQQD